MNRTGDTDCEHELLAYRAILDNAAVGIVCTRDRFFFRCNQRGSALLGYLIEDRGAFK